MALDIAVPPRKTLKAVYLVPNLCLVTRQIFVENPEGVTRGVAFIELDGIRLADDKIVLQDDGVVHQVRVVLGVG
ncbi:MAG: hypothetical protein HOP34_02315 [Methylococcaceae bacterium]|nr:hypothetical protein [Methylococcaceae bacterium]